MVLTVLFISQWLLQYYHYNISGSRRQAHVLRLEASCCWTRRSDTLLCFDALCMFVYCPQHVNTRHPISTFKQFLAHSPHRERDVDNKNMLLFTRLRRGLDWYNPCSASSILWGPNEDIISKVRIDPRPSTVISRSPTQHTRAQRVTRSKHFSLK